ncbi:MAG: MFS transporter [Chloroflexi bacterium]|nr:MFS transporter [Chloroflexota bacterium]
MGWVSLLTDISSEMILIVLPFFLANVLGVGASVIGVIEGVADSTATLSRAPSGWLSDRLRRRKSLTLLGYGLAAIAKPFLYIATSWGIVIAIRFTDRLGKGIRSAPRDALIAASANPAQRGRSFGFHRAMDTAGAMLGTLVAALVILTMQRGDILLERGSFHIIVFIAAIPAFLAVLVLWKFVREPKADTVGLTPASAEISARKFSTRFIILLGILVIFALANSSDAFLLLRAQDVGMPIFAIILLLAGFNLIGALLSTPAGILSDRIGRRWVIVAGWLLFALVYLGFGGAKTAWHVIPLFLIYGVYSAATEGAARALVADMVPSERRGTAYGLYYTAIGLTAFPASVLAGWLWDAFDPSMPFFVGAALAATAAILLAITLRGRKNAPRRSPLLPHLV